MKTVEIWCFAFTDFTNSNRFMDTEQDLETKAKAVSALLKARHIGKLAWETLWPWTTSCWGSQEGAGWQGQGHRASWATVEGSRVGGWWVQHRKKLSLPPLPYCQSGGLAADLPPPNISRMPCWDVGILWVQHQAQERTMCSSLMVLTFPPPFIIMCT